MTGTVKDETEVTQEKIRKSDLVRRIEEKSGEKWEDLSIEEKFSWLFNGA